MPSLLHAVARNPALPPELLGRLIADADEELAGALADRVDLAPDQVRQLAERSEFAALLLVADGRLTSGDVDPLARPTVAVALVEQGRGEPGWARLLALVPDPYVRQRLATCPELPDEVAELLAADESDDVVAELAVNTTWLDLLVRLAAHPSAMVRRWAAANEAMPAESLTALLDDPEVLVREQAAGNPTTPGAAAARLVADHAMIRQALAAHPGLPAETYQRLTRDEIPWVRSNLAQNPGIDERLIRHLAEDDGHDVRRSLAQHPAVPLDVLARLATTVKIGPILLPRIAGADPTELAELAASPEPRVRALVAARRDLPSALRDQLAADPVAKVVKSVAPDPDLSTAQLTAALDRFGTTVAAAVAANPGTPGALLDRIAATPTVPVKALRAVAAHPNSSPAALATCLASPDSRTAQAAAANPALPQAVMVELASS
ncbi:hypothetical protein [Kitasatospora cathayae]|uniref:Leucine rich repeat variant n=1 Tax=Kitasatospora cathayae TaxID=3004092 RepID=A0ABY7PYW1_9ACTN|nr:hypothetical protein [Kitasatospora sp. HUAS 3-15]WBP85600.1 hypothetical protein O1G21_06865 [Kitasatospora sp. HUAS 3-15]